MTRLLPAVATGNCREKPNNSKLSKTQPPPFRGRGNLVLERKPKLGPVQPCVRFWGPGRGTTPARRVTGPVGAGWGSCGRIQGKRKTQDERKLYSLRSERGESRETEDRQKRKNRPSWACKGSELRHKTSSIENGFFLHSENGFGED